jgi:hypothetical protein
MFINEQLALHMAQERMAETVRWAEQRRALRQARPSVGIRLDRTLVRLGHWLADQPSAALSPHPSLPAVWKPK